MDQYDKVVLALQSGDYWVDIEKGEVWSKKHNKSSTWRRIGTGDCGKGYYKITLYYPGGKLDTNTHRIVWMVANGRIPGGLEVDHKDDNRQNNSIDNLQLLSSAENNQKKPYGPRRKLTAEIVSTIRESYATGGSSLRVLGDQFGVSKSYVSQIVNHYRWSNV